MYVQAVVGHPTSATRVGFHGFCYSFNIDTLVIINIKWKVVIINLLIRVPLLCADVVLTEPVSDSRGWCCASIKSNDTDKNQDDKRLACGKGFFLSFFLPKFLCATLSLIHPSFFFLAI